MRRETLAQAIARKQRQYNPLGTDPISDDVLRGEELRTRAERSVWRRSNARKKMKLRLSLKGFLGLFSPKKSNTKDEPRSQTNASASDVMYFLKSSSDGDDFHF